MATKSRFRNFLGNASKVAPGVKSAKTVLKFAKAARRVWQLWFVITLIPVCCLCCFIVLGLFLVKRTLDDPFANITTVIKATTCAVSTDPNCVVKVFFDKTVEYSTNAMNED